MTKRIPDSVKALRGTMRADRARPSPGASERLVDVPDAPAHLSAAARAEWARLAAVLVALGTLTAADLRALELLCETLASAAAFGATIETDGPLIDSGGVRKAHPALQALATARSQARALLRDFGLVPGSRAGIETAPAPHEPDPLDEFCTAR